MNYDSSGVFIQRNSGNSRTNIIDVDPAEDSPTEPVTVDQAKEQCRVSFTDDDNFITGLITASRRAIEQYCSISLVQKTITVTLDMITDIELPYGPIVGDITSFTDNAGNAIPTGQYIVYGSKYKKILSRRPFYMAVLIYTAGPNGSIESDLQQAILNELAFRYDNRGEGEQLRNNVNPGVCNAARVLADPYIKQSWR